MDHLVAVAAAAGFAGLEPELVILGAEYRDPPRLAAVLAERDIRLGAIAFTGDWLHAEETPDERADADACLRLLKHVGEGKLFLSADEVGRLLVGRILEDLEPPSDSQLAVLINGLGATPLLEQYLVYRSVRNFLIARKMNVARSYVGEYITSLQMAGLHVTIMLLDDELLSLLDAPARTVAFVQ